MNISDAANKNYNDLFSSKESKLQITDPDLVEIFYNFAFDEVIDYGNLSAKTRLMVVLASLIASQALGEYKVMLGGALNIGVTPIEAKEIVYQAVPYAGIAKVFDFIQATNEVLESRGIKLPLKSQTTTTSKTRQEKGLVVQRLIFGDRINRLYEKSPANQLHIQKYLSANCFGDHYTRNGIEVKIRELLTFAMIISLGGCEQQLKGHIAGNVNIGNDKETLLSAVTQMIPFVGYPRALNAIKCLNEVIPE